MTEGSYSVSVWLFDLTKGLAKQLSAGFLGRQIDGVWHTSVVVYGREHFFGSEGISWVMPGTTLAGSRPDQEFVLGTTDIPPDIFYDYLQELGSTTFAGHRYSLLDHNCNNFSNEIATFLTGKEIPSFITSLPGEVLQTPFGQMLRPYIEAMTPQMNQPGRSNVSTPSSTTTLVPGSPQRQFPGGDPTIPTKSAEDSAIKQIRKPEKNITASPEMSFVQYHSNDKITQSCKILLATKSVADDLSGLLENVLDAISSDSSILVAANQLQAVTEYLSESNITTDDFVNVLSWLSSQRSFLNQVKSSEEFLTAITKEHNNTHVNQLSVVFCNFCTNEDIARRISSDCPRVFSVLSAALLAGDDTNLKVVSTTLYNISCFKCEIRESDEFVELLASSCHTINSLFSTCLDFPEEILYKLIVFLHFSAYYADSKNLLRALLLDSSFETPSKRVDESWTKLQNYISS